ncbi:MAG: GNAT family N-acetyltransferase [Candidatus Hermodarchaeota archaeon]
MSKHQVIIRGYQEGDKEKCHELWFELTERHREIYNDPSIGNEDPGYYFDEHLKRVGSHRIWIAESKGLVIGMVGLIVKGEEAEIEPVIVKKEHRNRGIGKILLNFIIREAEQTGIRFLSIKPVIRNIEAIRTFYNVGFQNVGSIELFMDLKKEKENEWNSVSIFGLEFYY